MLLVSFVFVLSSFVIMLTTCSPRLSLGAFSAFFVYCVSFLYVVSIVPSSSFYSACHGDSDYNQLLIVD